jgi:beta-fructofuranosidase
MPVLDESGERQDDMWLMAISINPGAPLGGSITEYFPGHFNGTHFVPVDGAARIADFGKDNYAGQWFYGQPEEDIPVSIAWASNWQYTQVRMRVILVLSMTNRSRWSLLAMRAGAAS